MFTRILRVASLIIACSAWTCSVQAQTVISNSNLIYERPGLFGGTFGFTSWQDAAKTDYTSVDFNYDGSNVSPGSVNLDEGSDWFVVNPGDLFNRAAIDAGLAKRLNFFVFSPGSHAPINVGTGDFYLGVNTGIGYNFETDRTVFGWVHLRPLNGVLTMVENVMSYNSRGIIVGTTTTVPEPAAIYSAVCAFLFCFACRRK